MQNNFFISSLILIITCFSSFAQSPTYADGMHFTIEGQTYVVDDTYHPFFSVQNVANTLSDKNPVDENGQEISPFDIVGGKLSVASVSAALMATFTREEAIALRDAELRLRLYLTMDNQGTVKEIVFLFYRNAAVSMVPPEIIALFEQNLKSSVCYEPSESEKRLQFYHCSFQLNLARLIPQYAFKGDRVEGEIVEGEPIP